MKFIRLGDDDSENGNRNGINIVRGRGRRGGVPSQMVLAALFAVTVFLILLTTMFIVGVTVTFLISAGIIDLTGMEENALRMPLLILLLTSVIVGTLVSFVFSRISTGPVYKLMHGMDKLASGDYGVRIHPMRGNDISRAVAQSFNTLAEELENTEMLRSDFINNFSHEFKTPIVSITGFATLLRQSGDDMTDEQRAEYLEIIENESSRLARLATNVLEITKLENQRILTDVTRYNLSEQIRTCVLLLEKKWTAKELELNLDFNEQMISANEELMRQVWINLLDNAVKFSPQGGRLDVNIRSGDGYIRVSVLNEGDPISPDSVKRIFNKFYQGETSHAAEGNGIGLAIVRRIAELHGGEVTVESRGRTNIFTITIPQP